MKKIVLFLSIAFLAVSINAQSFKGFFKPTELRFQENNNLKSATIDVKSSQWAFSPAVFITANAVEFTGGVAITKPLSSLGTGISFSNYINVNGVPYAQFNVSALVMTNINLNGTSLTSIGGGIVAGAFNGLFNVGGAILGGKTYLLLGTQIKI